jgi:hypothetical protein
MLSTSFVLLFYICLIALSSAIRPPIKSVAIIAKGSKNQKNGNGEVAVTLPSKDLLKDVITKRFPKAVISVPLLAIESYLPALFVGMLIGLVMAIPKPFPNFKARLIDGLKLGNDWGQVSAAFTAAEEFTKIMRAKEDKWNNVIGGGIGSGMIQLKEGPIGFVKGFSVGAMLVYSLNRVLEINPDAKKGGKKKKK